MASYEQNNRINPANDREYGLRLLYQGKASTGIDHKGNCENFRNGNSPVHVLQCSRARQEEGAALLDNQRVTWRYFR